MPNNIYVQTVVTLSKEYLLFLIRKCLANIWKNGKGGGRFVCDVVLKMSSLCNGFTGQNQSAQYCTIKGKRGMGKTP